MFGRKQLFQNNDDRLTAKYENAQMQGREVRFDMGYTQKEG